MKRLIWIAVVVAVVAGGYEFIGWYYSEPETGEMPFLEVASGEGFALDGPGEAIPAGEALEPEEPAPSAEAEEEEAPAPPDRVEEEAVAIPLTVGGGEEPQIPVETEEPVETEAPTPRIGAIGRALLDEEDAGRREALLRRLIREDPDNPELAGAVEAEAERARLEGEKAIEWEALSYLFFRLEAGGKRDRIRERLDTLIADIIFSRRPGPASELYLIQPGDSLQKIAARFNCPVDLLQRVNGIEDPSMIRQGDRLKVIDGHKEIVAPVEPGDTLEEISDRYRCSVKRIREINGIDGEEVKLGERIKVLVGAYEIRVKKRDFTLTVSHDGRYVRQYPVGIGADDRTPTGEFTVEEKIWHPTWYREGVIIPAGDPRNILGTRWLGFRRNDTARGIGIHGTTEPETIGSEASAGCIRLRNADVEELTSLTPRGTRVTIE